MQRRTWHCGFAFDQCAISHGIVDPREHHRIFHMTFAESFLDVLVLKVYMHLDVNGMFVCVTCVTYEELCFNTLGPADVLNAVHLVDEVV